MDICIVSTIWLLSVTLPWARLYSFAWAQVFSFLECILRSRIARSYGNSVLNIWGSIKQLSEAAIPFYSPVGSVWGFQFLYIFASSYSVTGLLDSSHPGGGEVSHRCFDFHFPIGHLHVLINHHLSSLKNAHSNNWPVLYLSSICYYWIVRVIVYFKLV
jgi:hypothetical protein